VILCSLGEGVIGRGDGKEEHTEEGATTLLMMSF